MIAVAIVFLILAIVCAGYLIWRFTRRSDFVLTYNRVIQWIDRALPKAWFGRKQVLSQKVAKTTTVLEPDSSLVAEKKHKVKTVKCRHCEQKTIVDESGCCQWCHYPLSTKPYEEAEKRGKKPKEPKPAKEKPIVVKAPFALSCVGCLVVLALVVLSLGGVFYGLLMTEVLDDVLGSNDIYLQIKAIVNPPKPEVVSQDVFEAAPGGDYTIIGKCQVRNGGGSGKIQVTARLNAYGQRLTKSKTIYLQKGQTEDVEFHFPEVTVERRILEGILSYLMGGGWRSVTSPNVDLDISAAPAR